VRSNNKSNDQGQFTIQHKQKQTANKQTTRNGSKFVVFCLEGGLLRCRQGRKKYEQKPAFCCHDVDRPACPVSGMAGDVKKTHLPAPRWAIRRTHDAVQGTHRAGKPLMWRLRCDGIELPAIPIDTKCVFGVARFRFPSAALPYEYRNGEGKRVKGRQRLLAPGSLLTVVGTHGEDVLVLAPDGTELLVPQSKTDFVESDTPYESKLDSALSDGCRPRGGPGRRGRQRVPIDPCLTTPSSPRQSSSPPRFWRGCLACKACAPEYGVSVLSAAGSAQPFAFRQGAG